MERNTFEQTQAPTILYGEVRILETQITYIKFNLFVAGPSFLSQSSGCKFAYFKRLFYVHYAFYRYITQPLSGRFFISK